MVAFTGSTTTIVIVLLVANTARDTRRAMSQENVELVRRYWQCRDRALERHWAERHAPVSESLEREGVFDLFQPDAEWISTFGSETFQGGRRVLAASTTG
jgi:hypothetical protein